jgi:PKHD-type hydroxylase
MILPIDDILTPEDLKQITESLNQAHFVDGKATAGWHAKLVKNNLQLDSQDPQLQTLRSQVETALAQNLLFQIAVRPRKIHSIRFSRYTDGMSYGSHVDNALMGGDQFLRSDVSFTLFLSAPESYEGGELVIESAEGDRSFKLQAGSAMVYSSSTLHRVEPVTQGERLVAVGWVQSLIRDAEKREILFDLDTARRSLFAREGKTIEFDLLSKSHANLLRQWVE